MSHQTIRHLIKTCDAYSCQQHINQPASWVQKQRTSEVCAIGSDKFACEMKSSPIHFVSKCPLVEIPLILQWHNGCRIFLLVLLREISSDLPANKAILMNIWLLNDEIMLISALVKFKLGIGLLIFGVCG